MPQGAGFGDGPRSELRRLLESMSQTLDLTREAIELLVRFAEFVPMAPGRTVCTSSQRTNVVRMVMHGLLEVLCYPVGHDPLIVQFLGPRTFICPPILAGEDVLRVTVVVREPGLLALIAYSEFQRAVGTLGVKAAGLQSWTFRRSMDLAYRKMALLRFNVLERLVIELPTLARLFPKSHDDGIVIDISLTHEDLARLIGATRSSVCRAIAALETCGYVKQLGPKRIAIGRALLELSPAAAIGAVAEFAD